MTSAFRSQSDNFNESFEAFVFMAPGRFCVTCKSVRKLEAAENYGYVVRGLPVTFKPVSLYKWVNVTRLSYGVPDDEISKTLSPYGNIRLIKSEQYSRVNTGVRNVLMEITSAIPARIRIAGHWCAIYYKGQKKLCFSCGTEGHFSSKCPGKDRRGEVRPVVQPHDDVHSSTLVNVGASTSVELEQPTLPPTVIPALVPEESLPVSTEVEDLLSSVVSDVCDNAVGDQVLPSLEQTMLLSDRSSLDSVPPVEHSVPVEDAPSFRSSRPSRSKASPGVCSKRTRSNSIFSKPSLSHTREG